MKAKVSFVQDGGIEKPLFEDDIDKEDSDSIYSFDVDLEDDPSEEESVIYQTGY
jgi:hypothetical protein